MRINLFNTYRSQALLKKSPEAVQETGSEAYLSKFSYKDLAFKANSRVFVKPIFENSITEKLANKLSFYSSKIPEMSKTSKPLIFKYENGIAGFSIDKTKKDLTKISIKMLDGRDKFDDWNSPQGDFSALEIVLNKNGQMINGLYYDMPNRMNYLFERAPKNVRKMRYANADYKPSSNDIGWERLSASPGTYQFVTSFQNILDYPQTWLQELFIKLAQKNTALF